MNLLQRLTRRPAAAEAARSISFDELGFLYGGHQYPMLNTTWSQSGDKDVQVTSFDDYALRLLSANPIVFAAASIRAAVFSQARMVWRRRVNGKVVDTFTDTLLDPLQRPWAGGTTSDLLARMLLHVDVAGNAFVRRDGSGKLFLLRPDRVSILIGSKLDVDDASQAEDAAVVGYLYEAGGRTRVFLPDEVAHFAPTPDPRSPFRGMSWMTPVVREIMGDTAATSHKLKFFDNAATPNMLVKFDMALPQEKVEAFKELFEGDHAGVANAYKTLFLGGGADATVLGRDMVQMDFSRTQGKGETRILMAAGVHPVIAGASEGLAGSSLNAGNFSAAKRAFSDIRLQHLWVNVCSSLSAIVQPSDTSGQVELWFDKSEIPFLQDDLADTAEIQQRRAGAIRTLTDAGYLPESVVQAIVNDDMTQLRHSGLFSVQLQKPANKDPALSPEPEPARSRELVRDDAGRVVRIVG